MDLFGVPIGQLTLNGIALLVISSVATGLITGFIIPLRTHNREIAAERQRSADFKELYETADKRATLLETQIGTTVIKILDALPVPKDTGADE